MVDVTSCRLSEIEGLEEDESVVSVVVKVIGNAVSVVSMVVVEEGSGPDSVVSLVADVDEVLSSVVVSLVKSVVVDPAGSLPVEEADEVT